LSEGEEKTEGRRGAGSNRKKAPWKSWTYSFEGRHPQRCGNWAAANRKGIYSGDRGGGGTFVRTGEMKKVSDSPHPRARRIAQNEKKIEKIGKPRAIAVLTYERRRRTLAITSASKKRRGGQNQASGAPRRVLSLFKNSSRRKRRETIFGGSRGFRQKYRGKKIRVSARRREKKSETCSQLRWWSGMEGRNDGKERHQHLSLGQTVHSPETSSHKRNKRSAGKKGPGGRACTQKIIPTSERLHRLFVKPARGAPGTRKT